MLLHLFALLALAKSISPSRGGVFDPAECYTSYDSQLLDCSSQGLEFVPPLPIEVSSVILKDNQIKLIEPILPPTLTELDLSNNLLFTLELTSPHLLTLQISGNPLLTLTLNTSELRFLNASSCSLKFLPPGFFDRLPRLEILDLSANGLLRAIPPNNLQELFLQKTSIRSLPHMPNLAVLDVSNNFLLNLQTGESLKNLKAANCSLLNVILNRGLLSADLANNQITSLKIHENLEYLDASNNSLSTLDIDNARLHTVILANNKLTDLRVSSRYLKTMDLSRNAIMEISVHCSQCIVDCSFCQVHEVKLTNVKYLNLQYNNIEKITIEGVNEIDLRFNLLTEVTIISANFFDLRNNALNDPNKVNINEGAGYLANNPWACKCEGLRALRQRSIDKQLTCDGLTYESCFAGPRKSSHSAWVTLVVALILLSVFTLILYFVKLTSKGSSSLPDHDPVDSPECEIRDPQLPTYEEALRMSKPEYRQARSGSRRGRQY